MARARNIKPAFFDNDELAENEPLGRLLFIGLWTLCDFNGNLEWRSKRIQKQLLAYDKCDIDKLAINLDKSGFVRFYSDGDKIYLNVVNFSKHQNPHKNEKAKGSEIPDYSEEYRQLIDLKGLKINLDKSGLKQEQSSTNPADSLILNPEPLNLNPESDSQQVDESRFAEFWDLYGKKRGRDSCEKKFNKLKKHEVEKIFDVLPDYIASTPDIKYRKDPATWLNNKCWEDEIYTDSKSSKHDLSDIQYQSGRF
jgi:hypothetical protein